MRHVKNLKRNTMLKAIFSIALLQACQVASASSSNQNLQRIAAEDQADRAVGTNHIDWSVVEKKDAARRERVAQLLNAGDIRTAEDFLNAALVFQHSDSVEDTQLALALATLAAKMNPNNRNATVLMADAWDRIMVRSGQPQWYGTQFVKSKTTHEWVLYPTAPNVITEAQRKAMGLPTLEEDNAHLEEINKN